MDDICPLLSIGKDKLVNCTARCAWLDTSTEECAISRINGNLKELPDINSGIVGIDKSVDQLDTTMSKCFDALIASNS